MREYGCRALENKVYCSRSSSRPKLLDSCESEG